MPVTDAKPPVKAADEGGSAPTAASARPPAHGEVVAVRAPAEKTLTRQGLPYFLGISAATVGARGLAMHLVSIPPGAASEPHIHRGYETAIYVLQGRVETRYGAGLAHSVISEPGDFLFIPPTSRTSQSTSAPPNPRARSWRATTPTNTNRSSSTIRTPKRPARSLPAAQRNAGRNTAGKTYAC